VFPASELIITISEHLQMEVAAVNPANEAENKFVYTYT
jgi:hypothetical protein